MFAAIGYKLESFLVRWGSISYLGIKVIAKFFLGRFKVSLTIDQMLHLGIKSIGITALTSIFVGMAFTIQVVREFLKFGAGEMVGGVVALAVWRELGPLLTGVVFAGRVGAAISAEVGTMKVTEQVEALEAMSQSTEEYLVIPRVVACTFIMPLLVGVADILGFLSGFIVAVGSQKINPYAYFNSANMMLSTIDITGGFIKAALFGFLIALISSHIGLETEAGARGVGRNTTKAVVVSLVAIFISNYFLSVSIYQ